MPAGGVPTSGPGAPPADILLEIRGQFGGHGVPVCVSRPGSDGTAPLHPAVVPPRPQLLLWGSAGRYGFGPGPLPWKMSGSCS